jgi:UPF0755 protein
VRKRLLGAVAAVFVVVLMLGAAGGWYVWRQRWASQAVGGPQRTVRVTIEPGATVAAVGKELEQKGLIRSADFFARLGRDATVQPGVYDLSPTERPARLLRRLREGDVATTRVTFPEGFTVAQIATRLVRNSLIPDEAGFLSLVTAKGSTLKTSFPLPAHLEGYLFPDTYRFPIGASETEIAQQMVSNFDRLVARGKESDIRASGHSLADIVNVAAMVEREAETAGDRPLIAGVIYNRLARNMRLEIDATVQYARGQHKSRLLFRDLEIDSPYNTYRVAGLPAGPICNPGMASIEAALHPTASEYLYYVARPDGSHIFGRTFAEHQRNIAEARRLAREARSR